MKTLFLFLLTLLCWSSTVAQTTTFKDGRWFNSAKSPNYYRQPIAEPSQVRISPDSIVVQLGSARHSYSIKNVTSSPKEAKIEYKVDDNGSEMVISLSRGTEPYLDGKRKVAWITSSKWIMIVPLKDIDPPGYLFPGDNMINVEAARSQLIGYYKFNNLLSMSRQQINEKNKYAFAEDFRLEATDCEKDLRVEFSPNNKATWWSGHDFEGCNKTTQEIAWELKEVVVNGEWRLYLILKEDGDSNSYVVVDQEKGRLGLSGEFNLGGDSTHEGVLELVKTKRKK